MSGDQSPSLLPNNLSQDTKAFSNLAQEMPSNHLAQEMPSNHLVVDAPSSVEVPILKSPKKDHDLGMKQLSLENSENSVHNSRGGSPISVLRSSQNSPTHITRRSSHKVSPLAHSGKSSPTPSSVKDSPAGSGHNSPAGSGKNSPSSVTGRNSPSLSIKTKFPFIKGSPSPRRKNVAYLSEDAQTAAGTLSTRCSSPMTERKFQFLQNWSFFSRSPDASPSVDRKSQKKGMSDKESFQVAPSYSYLSDQLRRVSAGSFQCAIFCGGQNCKYEGASHWGENDMAIKGLYSHWITDDVLAMARPSAKLFHEQSIIKEFKT